MVRMWFYVVLGGECGGVGDLLEFEGECFVFGMGIVACVEFYDWSAE